MKLELHTNATVVDDAIKFVEKSSRSRRNDDDDDDDDITQQNENDEEEITNKIF
jgi:hypothetical protein